MKNIKTLLVTLLVASSCILAGCGSGGNTDVTMTYGGLGANPCPGHGVAVIGTTNTRGQTTPAVQYAQQLCVGWSVGTQYADEASCVASLTTANYGLTTAQAQAECSHTMTAAECADVEHDYVDSVGVKHMFVLSSTTTNRYLTGFWVMGDCSGTGTTPLCSGSDYVGVGCTSN
jgi:hypothetical protein